MKTHTQSQQTDSSSVQAKAQNQAEKSSILQAYKNKTAQLAESEEEEKPAQLKENKTGLPDQLKSGVENLSGHSLDDVKVHYNSSQPAALQAHAYAQGTDIHVAPGQEKHLPHEAWHVVQQKQGRVQPTKQMKGTVPVNDDAGLEKEADVMGAKALNSRKSNPDFAQLKSNSTTAAIQFALPGSYEPSYAPDYNPHGKKDTYRNGVSNFERLATSGFIGTWREKMIDHWNDKGWVHEDDYSGARYIKEQKNEKWVHENGIQLDHATTVATMKQDLLNTDKNSAINAVYADSEMGDYYHIEDGNYSHVTWPSSKTHAKKKSNFKYHTVEPTIHAARKYYHDMENLVPLMGVDNASKGDQDEEIIDWDQDFLDNQKEWQEMTNWANWGVNEKDIDEVQSAVTSMQETLDEYDGDWPID